ncbi:unnamed protein product [Owenia fusiformis]|uniref:Uncharacterized protein n=1 Tax=Owenia fusiformis TaxID=6347 RepID=A0A8J1TES2_OWEFU|nr:unnamed protein product [Owenia fusiformis]
MLKSADELIERSGTTMADKTKQLRSTLAFTLPISCQICLGKVKDPTVCPNRHVFCSGCMDVWLQRNQQCPSCRVPITTENPCKPILGGHSDQPAGGGSDRLLSTPQLRKARLDIIYNDLEEEIQRLEKQVQTTTVENEALKLQLESANQIHEPEVNGDTDQQGERSKCECGRSGQGQGIDMMVVITNKLKDATMQYEKVKEDIEKLKKINSRLEDDLSNQTRETQRMKVELATRSPQRFGRYTVAALESKCEKYEREIRQLQKALERSDNYIADLEKQLESRKHNETDKNQPSDYSIFNNDGSKKTVSENFSKSEESISQLGLPKFDIANFKSGTVDDGKLSPNSSSARRNLFSNDTGNAKSPTTTRRFYGQPSTHNAIGNSHNAFEVGDSADDSLDDSYFRSKTDAIKPGITSKALSSTLNTRPNQHDTASNSYKLKNQSSPKGKNSSFEFEQPSPVTPSTKLAKLSLNRHGSNSVESTPEKSPSLPKKFYRSSSFELKSQNTGIFSDTQHKSNILKFNKPSGSDIKSKPVPRVTALKSEYSVIDTHNHRVDDSIDVTLDTTTAAQNELNDLDITITPELTDCMKLFNAAQRNVEKRENSSNSSKTSQDQSNSLSRDIPTGSKLNLQEGTSSSGSDPIKNPYTYSGKGLALVKPSTTHGEFSSIFGNSSKALSNGNDKPDSNQRQTFTGIQLSTETITLKDYPLFAIDKPTTENNKSAQAHKDSMYNSVQYRQNGGYDTGRYRKRSIGDSTVDSWLPSSPSKTTKLN